jgi:bifunctional ADP-heptose synthase (sugar kinase/adenylyltransferase)
VMLDRFIYGRTDRVSPDIARRISTIGAVMRLCS